MSELIKVKLVGLYHSKCDILIVLSFYGFVFWSEFGHEMQKKKSTFPPPPLAINFDSAWIEEYGNNLPRKNCFDCACVATEDDVSAIPWIPFKYNNPKSTSNPMKRAQLICFFLPDKLCVMVSMVDHIL